ncbi:MAG: sugar transferase [Sphaerochaetaceae bacterium]|nr:sugar transferase [Sphaerochaetaceae bacterium]
MDTNTRYVITVTGPVGSRNEQVARALAERLHVDQVYSCHTLFPDKQTLSQMQEMSVEEIGNILDRYRYTAEYLVVHGENILSLKSMRTLSALKIYVEADDIEITSSVLQQADFSDTKETLSAQVKKILKTQSDTIEQETVSSRRFADIIISADETPEEAVLSIGRYITRTDPRTRAETLNEKERKERIDQMLRQYRNPAGQTRKAKIKRALWRFVIKATLAFKRILDILISLVALILLSPLLIAVALIIKLTDGGNVFYVQTRIGKQGKPFPFPKFRSMVVDADKLKDNLLDQAERKGDVTFKMKKDPRVTPIGRFIRRFSIDELPQIWCVLIGDMSIVGPRPPVPREVALYTQEDRRRLEVTPGLTGIWQVSGRSDIGFKQQVELDVLYIESHGFLLDLKLILKTIPAVLSGKGAY